MKRATMAVESEKRQRVDTMATAEIKEVIVLGASGGFGTLFSQVLAKSA